MSSPLLQLRGISKSFPGVQALREVSLNLTRGSIHALVGENGAGKSTLINILGGVLSPTSGTLLFNGQPAYFRDARHAHAHGIVIVHQEVDLFPDLTVAENIALERGLPRRAGFFVDWPALRRGSQQALAQMTDCLPAQLLAGDLTPAERQLLLLSAALAEAPRLLILDEPTSSLSGAEVERLFEHLRQLRTQGCAILYVSHRLEEIFALADEVTVLCDGQRVWQGPISATTPSQLIAQMVQGKDLGHAPPRAALQDPTIPPLLRCERLSDGTGSCRDITLEVRPGEVLGLYGLVGAGRSEWAQAVFGLRPVVAGTIEVAGWQTAGATTGEMMRHGLAYVPEDRLRQGLCRGLSVTANAVLSVLRRLASGPWVPAQREDQVARRLIEQLGIKARSPGQVIGTLSGGNQQKVVVGRWLECQPHVLILDEPTRGVDVGAKAELHALLQQLASTGRAVILISSDLPEILAQSHRIGVFRQGRLVGFFDPNTSTAAEIATAALPQAGRNTSPEPPPQSDLSPQPRNPSPQPPPRSGEGEQAAEAPPRSGKGLRRGGSTRWPRELGLLCAVLVFFAYLELHTGQLLTTASLHTLALDTALLACSALGVGLVIIAGGIDISIGALMALAAGVAAQLWLRGWPVPVVVLSAITVGSLGGVLNATLSLLGRVHPIVITLGTLSLYRGLAQWMIGGILQVRGAERFWRLTPILGIPFFELLGPLLVLLVWALLRHTIVGRELYALGSNPRAAQRAGLRPGHIWLRAFALQGALVGLAGFLMLTHVGVVENTSFEDITLQAIAAAVVGGVAITGGRGSAWGIALGSVLLTSLGPACIYLGIPTLWQRTLVGCVLAVAVTLDVLWRRGNS